MPSLTEILGTEKSFSNIVKEKASGKSSRLKRSNEKLGPNRNGSMTTRTMH